ARRHALSRALRVGDVDVRGLARRHAPPRAAGHAETHGSARAGTLRGTVLIRRGAPEVTLADLDAMPFVARVVRTFEDGLEPFELEIGPAGLEFAPLEQG